MSHDPSVPEKTEPLRYLHVGGLVAMRFDPSGEYLLRVSHSGRGVFSTRTWERVARDRNWRIPKTAVPSASVRSPDSQFP
jgi:hypothetical protein